MSSLATPAALIERLDSQGLLARWASTEPALTAVEGVRELAELLLNPSDRVQADELFGALLRLAAMDGGDDRDAALLLMYLLGGGSKHLAVQLRDLTDSDELVAGELWLHIRSFPWRRRRRGFVKGLLLDTRRAVLAPVLQQRKGWTHSQELVLLIDGQDPTGMLATSYVESHDRPGGVTLLGVLEWAQRSGVVSAADVALLLELVAAGDVLDEISDGPARRGLNVAAEIRDVAVRRGVSEKTVRRHRDSAVAAMRHARQHYLLSDMCA